MNIGFLQLRSDARWLLMVSGIFSLSIALSNTFVNVYLWKVDKTYGAIGVYNLYLYIAIPITFVLAGVWASKRSTVWTLRVGILAHAVFYAVALIGGTAVAKLPYMLGMVMGFAAGMYWFSFNTLSLEFTGHGKRDKFFGMNGVMGAIAGIVAPPLAGLLIASEDRFSPVTGYHVIFALSLALFVFAAVVTIKLKSKENPASMHVNVAWAALRHRWWRLLMVGCMAYGLREGVFLFLIGLLLYVATGSELRLGAFVLVQSALSFVSFFIVGRIVRPANRLRILGLGAVALSGAALFFLVPIRPIVILLYGSVVAIVIPLFLVPLQGFVFDGISTLRGAKGANEHIITREVFENAGRVLGIAAFLTLLRISHSARFVPTLAVGLGFVQLLTWMLLKAGGIQRLVDGADREAVAAPRTGGGSFIRLKAQRVWSVKTRNEEAQRLPRWLKSISRRAPH